MGKKKIIKTKQISQEESFPVGEHSEILDILKSALTNFPTVFLQDGCCKKNTS